MSVDPPRDDGRDAGDDTGYSMVELLVVILIIGILAGIAIPLFLVQRQKGDDAQARSDLRQLAGFEEIYLNDHDRYGTIAEIRADEPGLKVSSGVTLTVVRYDAANGYCLKAQQASSPTVWYYDSQGGGLLPKSVTSCPATRAGTAGDSVTGS